MENVLLIFGGMSYEHDISIVTASQIFNKTRLKDYNLIPIYISKGNRFFAYKNDKFNLSDFSNFEENKQNKYFKEIVFVSGNKGVVFYKTIFGLKEYIRSNIAILACHGGNGENGKLVAYLELFGIYSSAGSVEGLGISMNKMHFKNYMKGLKLPVVSGFVISSKKYFENKNIYDLKLKFAKFPLVLKPVNGGSSIGLFVAKTKAEFEKMLFSAFEFDDNVLVENFISQAREFNIAVLGDVDNFKISEVDEPLKLNEILSFDDKYLNNGSKNSKCGAKETGSMVSQNRKFPANISSILRERLRNLAMKAFISLNLSGVVRIDFLYDEQKDKVYICEINSIPGSLSYYFFCQGEVLIDKFICELISLAKVKKDKGLNIKIDYITKILN